MVILHWTKVVQVIDFSTSLLQLIDHFCYSHAILRNQNRSNYKTTIFNI